jgi:hypothetical protein
MPFPDLHWDCRQPEQAIVTPMPDTDGMRIAKRLAMINRTLMD